MRKYVDGCLKNGKRTANAWQTTEGWVVVSKD